MMLPPQSLLSLGILLLLLQLQPGVAGGGDPLPRFICTPLPPDADPPRSCPPPAPHAEEERGGPLHVEAGGAWHEEGARRIILRLREALVQQREAALEQREAARELAAKLARCQAHGPSPEDAAAASHGEDAASQEEEEGARRALEELRKQLQQLQATNSSGLGQALQHQVGLLELQLRPHRSLRTSSHHGHHHGDHGHHHGDHGHHHGDHGHHHRDHGHHHGDHSHHEKQGYHPQGLHSHHPGDKLGHHSLRFGHHHQHGDHSKAGDHSGHPKGLHGHHHHPSPSGGDHHKKQGYHPEGLHGHHNEDHGKAGGHDEGLLGNQLGHHSDHHEKQGQHSLLLGHHHVHRHSNHQGHHHGDYHHHGKASDLDSHHSPSGGNHHHHSKANDLGGHHSTPGSHHHHGKTKNPSGHNSPPISHQHQGSPQDDLDKASGGGHHNGLGGHPPGGLVPLSNQSKGGGHGPPPQSSLHSNHLGPHWGKLGPFREPHQLFGSHGGNQVHQQPWATGQGPQEEEEAEERGGEEEEEEEEEDDDDDPQERGGLRDNHRALRGSSGGGFRLSFPLRTNYLFARLRGPLRQPLGALSLCLWLRPRGGPPLGTPFSYAAPGQPNELVLLAWGGRPMELLVDDQAVPLALTPSPGRWHHLCVTWAAAGGTWRSFQDGVPRGRGGGLAAGHPLRPHGVLVLGQEQDALGGGFDASQAFVGDLAELHLWGRVLGATEVAAVASCSHRPAGDLLAWAEGGLELHGGVTALPFEPCP